MNDQNESEQSVAASNPETNSGRDRFTLGGKREINTSSNWAWANPHGQYDWMDSNSPFISSR
jgi:hypothetical protein